MAERRGDEVREWLREAGLPVSALSLSVEYTSEEDKRWRANVDETCRFIRLCKEFKTSILKTMPGRPSSAQATPRHWDQYRRAMDIIVPVARSEGVKIAVETHLNHLSDSIETALRCIELGDPEVVGFNLDFCNVHTCHESALDAIGRFRGRIFFAHIKDSLFTTASGDYVPLGQGKMDYVPILKRLRAVAYDGYLSVECLYPQAKLQDPQGAVARDLRVLCRLLV
jgi:sugar phosphate isomerase/epimerase